MLVSVVVTSIASPNPALRAISRGAIDAGWDFVVVGDAKSPRTFVLEGCRFIGVEQQLGSGLAYARACPLNHYARKNIGYLDAISRGAACIVETDDDNIPRPEFFLPKTSTCHTHQISDAGWVNAYRYFTDAHIWPRGLPLDQIHAAPPSLRDLPKAQVDCPIQQALADDNPDVDAIYRLVMPLPQRFQNNIEVALGPGSWCPFNSQNTTWWSDAFPLLYLPAYCSFRMTDIWRSFVAQRIAWENGWNILFRSPTVYQERNEHSLMKDFADEVPGFLHNDRIRGLLDSLSLAPGIHNISANMERCYQALIDAEIVGPGELKLLHAWIDDLAQATHKGTGPQQSFVSG